MRPFGDPGVARSSRGVLYVFFMKRRYSRFRFNHDAARESLEDRLGRRCATPRRADATSLAPAVQLKGAPR